MRPLSLSSARRMPTVETYGGGGCSTWELFRGQPCWSQATSEEGRVGTVRQACQRNVHSESQITVADEQRLLATKAAGATEPGASVPLYGPSAVQLAEHPRQKNKLGCDKGQWAHPCTAMPHRTKTAPVSYLCDAELSEIATPARHPATGRASGNEGI